MLFFLLQQTICSNIPVQRLVQSVKQVKSRLSNIVGANKLFSDKASGLEDDQGGLDGPLHQQGHHEEETLLAPRLQVHHHVQGKTANIW